MIARVKKHRWHQKVLKAQDPITISLGCKRRGEQRLYLLHAFTTVLLVVLTTSPFTLFLIHLPVGAGSKRCRSTRRRTLI